jgi:hypothetical protein
MCVWSCRAVDWGKYGRRWSLMRRSPSERDLVIWIMWLLYSPLLWAGLVHAQSISYVYGAKSRVVAVTVNNDSIVHTATTHRATSARSALLFWRRQMMIFVFMQRLDVSKRDRVIAISRQNIAVD